jgi:hypothetical protein
VTLSGASSRRIARAIRAYWVPSLLGTIPRKASSTKKADQEFTDKHPDIAWLTIYAMRNHVLHAYFQLDLKIVFKMIVSDLPRRCCINPPAPPMGTLARW